MGVLFGILSGYYYWSPLMIGYIYNEILSKIQYYTLFIGVNLTFFPMHFIGMNGLPRRYVDMPEQWANTNYLISIGSFISFISLFLFIYIVYRQLSDKIIFKGWLTKSFFNHYRIKSIEWSLNFPFNFHTYKENPVI